MTHPTRYPDSSKGNDFTLGGYTHTQAIATVQYGHEAKVVANLE